ncbi:hypothetical protein SKAU_G00030340 [Synaphobranchus kaupii]|uniref:Uncharacterized protein n=1 Tax=Synaphobranchus kaupii TaxID=118154 RepID=A0A9Q1JD39_SYNKA|nr:hypothetical protein SKAU_G00030340 [Synaphobranchus kaupii]
MWMRACYKRRRLNALTWKTTSRMVSDFLLFRVIGTGGPLGWPELDAGGCLISRTPHAPPPPPNRVGGTHFPYPLSLLLADGWDDEGCIPLDPPPLHIGLGTEAQSCCLCPDCGGGIVPLFLPLQILSCDTE